MLNVVDNTQEDILIEKSKWFAHQGDVHKALLCLQKGTANMTIDLDQSNYNDAKVDLNFSEKQILNHLLKFIGFAFAIKEN